MLSAGKQAQGIRRCFCQPGRWQRRRYSGAIAESDGWITVSPCLARDIMARFKASGPGRQTRMNNALRDAAGP
ncbi:BrnA antitoxin family protein [Paracoccus actinidiae]|uniref:BrnA antitoxin family protein n=1 Tax=Paracoccus actinidiae TaxID=3064531 RepID=UPI0027D2097A|nr:BrnA antitoxin family protein [Paracoccus sp. M09]